MKKSQKDLQAVKDLDSVAYANLSKMTKGLSPVSLLNAYNDWLLHFAISPGKQQALVEKGYEQATHFREHMLKSVSGDCEPCIEPLPQDNRFSAASWQAWPYNLIYQSFLLRQQWWHNATTDVPGVTEHHEKQMTFAVRQLLDIFSPSNFFMTNPEALQAAVQSGGMSLLQGMQYRYEDITRLLTKGPVPGTENFRPGHEVAITPGKVVFRNHLIELIQYSPQSKTVFSEPLLIIPSWILKFYILDLSPHNSLVNYLVEKGHTVFMVSWRNPDADDRDLGMDDYLKSGVMSAIDVVSNIVGPQKIQAVGYCLGGTLLGMAAALMARNNDDRLKSLTLLASELDFTEPGELGLLIDDSQLAFLDGIMFKQGYLDGKQMAGAFALLNSRDLVWSLMERSYLLGQKRPVNDLASWNSDATRMPYRQHSEYLRRLYLNNDLAAGRYLVDGKPIALSDIRIPVFALGTERDTVSPWNSVYKVHQLTPNTDVTFCLTSGGHNVGVVNPPGSHPKASFRLATRSLSDPYTGSEAWLNKAASSPGSWWPAWEDWLRQNATKRISAEQQAGNSTYPPLEDAPGHYVSIL